MLLGLYTICLVIEKLIYQRTENTFINTTRFRYRHLILLVLTSLCQVLLQRLTQQRELEILWAIRLCLSHYSYLYRHKVVLRP